MPSMGRNPQAPLDGMRIPGVSPPNSTFVRGGSSASAMCHALSWQRWPSSWMCPEKGCCCKAKRRRREVTPGLLAPRGVNESNSLLKFTNILKHETRGHSPRNETRLQKESKTPTVKHMTNLIQPSSGVDVKRSKLRRLEETQVGMVCFPSNCTSKPRQHPRNQDLCAISLPKETTRNKILTQGTAFLGGCAGLGALPNPVPIASSMGRPQPERNWTLLS